MFRILIISIVSYFAFIAGASAAPVTSIADVENLHLSASCKIRKEIVDCEGEKTDAFHLVNPQKKGVLTTTLKSCTPSQIKVFEKFYFDHFKKDEAKLALDSVSVKKCVIVSNQNKPALATGEADQIIDWGRSFGKETSSNAFIFRLDESLNPIKMEYGEITYYGSRIASLCDSTSSGTASIIINMTYDAALAMRAYSFSGNELVGKEYPVGCGD